MNYKAVANPEVAIFTNKIPVFQQFDCFGVNNYGFIIRKPLFVQLFRYLW